MIITFEQIHAIVGQQPQPIDGGTAVLTPLGHAHVAGYRFVKALRELPAAERAETLAVFAEELRSVIATLAAGA
jgi:hypothetical protein